MLTNISNVSYIQPLFELCCHTIAVHKCDPGKGDKSCCTKRNQCKEGEGDCDADSQCKGNLVCGKNNCKKWNPAARADFDCCEGN